MTYKAQQVLRTKINLRGEGGTAVPAGTRVVVMSYKEGRARVKVADPQALTIAKVRLTAKTEHFTKTHRGRPKLKA
jgi:hypothetical protein